MSNYHAVVPCAPEEGEVPLMQKWSQGASSLTNQSHALFLLFAPCLTVLINVSMSFPQFIMPRRNASYPTLLVPGPLIPPRVVPHVLEDSARKLRTSLFALENQISAIAAQPHDVRAVLLLLLHAFGRWTTKSITFSRSCH